MKKKGFIKSNYKILVFIGIIIVGYFINKSSQSIDDEIKQNGKYAIGTFKEFSMSFGHAGGRSLEYFYYDNVGKYENGSNSNIFPDKEKRKTIFEGDQFLVLYDNDGSMIFFECPIKDSTDFKRYVKEFEEKRKKQNK
ncbi:hypothetical protein [Roseimarinus sediminis]|uniref:hypothetical protein n=1 Tax=Roseimarinus sediminis TaxID=1610899 RepID=UPI003D1DD9E6